MLVHLDLFSGIGGFALACQWAGIETICFVENDQYCQKVLRKHWPGVPIVEDIRDVEEIKRIVAYANEGRYTPVLGEAIPEGQGKTKPNSQSGSRSRTRDTLLGKLQDEKIKEIVANAEGRGSQAGAIINGEASKDGGLDAVGYSETRLGTRGNTARESPTILATAGIPCQPFSVAGKRGGARDDRYLWPETLAVIEAIKPTWILLENVTGIKSVYQSDMLSELEARKYNTEEEATADFSGVLEREATNILWLVLEGLRGAGYEVEVLVIPACAVNAPHRRDRVWIVANSRCGEQGECGNTNEVSNGRHSETRPASEIGRPSDIIPDTKQEGLEGRKRNSSSGEGQGFKGEQHNRDKVGGSSGCPGGSRDEGAGWWAVEPELGRVAHGIPARVDRLKCLGNAIVPQVAYEIIKVIWRYETPRDNLQSG